MRWKKYLYTLFLFYSTPLLGQGIDKIWPMGYDCCQYPGFGAVNLNFNSGSLSVIQLQRHMNLNRTNASITNASNQLLFISNGIYIANALDDTMQNGGGLNPSYFTNQHLHYGLTLHQGNMVLPSLTDTNQYILFHNTIDDYFNTGASTQLYFSIIDMSLNNGLGGVVSKNNILYTDSMVPGRITACRHANGRDWWIIVHKLHSTDLFEFLYTPYGIIGPIIQTLATWRDFYLGQSAFSPQGNRYAYYEASYDLDISDFDRCTGNFINQIHIDINDSFPTDGGIAFSPSGRYLYVSSVSYLYQYDIWSSNIDSSRIVVGVYDGFYDSLGNGTRFEMQMLAPDGKIYMSATNSTPYLHVINYPDSAGLACGFCQHCISLPVLNAFTIPNFPNYYLGAEIGSSCDSLLNYKGEIPVTQSLVVSPNPTHDSHLKITYPTLREPGVFEILNSQSITVGKFHLPVWSSIQNIELPSECGPGIYFGRLRSGKTFFECKIVVQ